MPRLVNTGNTRTNKQAKGGLKGIEMRTKSSPKSSRRHHPAAGQAEARHPQQEEGRSSSPTTMGNTPLSSSSPSKSLCHQFVFESIWPGMGLFGESYLLFSIGTVKPIWEYLYPDCFNLEVCSSTLMGSLTYSVVLGVMTGMVVVGYAANDLGRRRGSILTASIMATGAWGVTLVSIFLTDHVVWLYRSLSILFFLFGVGVGGEYPLSASSASEFAMEELNARDRELLQTIQEDDENNPSHFYKAMYENNNKTTTTTRHNRNMPQVTLYTNPQRQQHRGRHIQLVFSMQGVGILCNSLTMTLLLWITGAHQRRNNGDGDNDNNDDDGAQQQEPEYSTQSLLMVWRITYALGALVLSYVVYSRYRHLKESHVWEDDRQKREHIHKSRSTLLETVLKKKKEEEQFPEPPLLTSSSTVSSLSAPSVIVDYHSQAIHTTGFVRHDGGEHHHHHHSPTTPDNQHHHHGPLLRTHSSDPEDDLKASPTRLFFQNYGLRLTGASLSWLAWDISFYGNKLFQSTFLLTLTGESTTLFQFSLAASLNAAIALLGYFGAALLVDSVGRRDLQQFGFLVTGSLFVSCGFLYYDLSSTALVALYLGTSFFGQLGPNCTTFMLPAELFPTEMRTMAHGICAASGKAGALIAAVLFQYLDNDLDLFLFSGYASFVACFITFCTIPETLGLDLYEVDKKWRMTLEGRKGEYIGDANNPKYLSYFERSKLHGTGGHDVEVE